MYHNYFFLFITWFSIIYPINYFIEIEKIYLLCAIGLLISLYTCYSELKLIYFGETSSSCDLNNKYMCSKVITSEYSKIFFDIPNCIFGVFTYPLIGYLYYINYNYIVLINIAWFMSLTLSYLLLFVLKHSCVLCTGIHVVNFLLLWNYNFKLLIMSILVIIIIGNHEEINLKNIIKNTCKELNKMLIKKIRNIYNKIKNDYMVELIKDD